MTDQISYRVGRSWGVTVVRETPGQPDQLVGTMQRAEDAQLIVDTLNESNRELCAQIVANQQLARKLALAEDALRAAFPVVAYVSTGRSFVGVEPYPDATARRVAALIDDAIGPTQP